MPLFISKHPLILHKISLLRRSRDLSSKEFRELLQEVALILGVELTSSLDLVMEQLKQQDGQTFRLKDKISLFPILRAGLGMVQAFLTLLPSSRTHHLGLYREKQTLLPVEYYNKLPASSEPDCSVAIVLDPMVATAGTAIATIQILLEWGLPLDKIRFCCVLGSREGLDLLVETYPGLNVWVGCVDEGPLSVDGHVVPGLGDAGDRLFHTC